MVGSATKLNCPHVQMAGDRVKENITFAHQGYIMLGWAIWNCQHLINYCQLYRFNLTAKRQEESHPLANTYSSLHLYVSWFRLIKLFTLYNILWAFCWKPEIQRGLTVAKKGERLSPSQFTHQGAKISPSIHFPMTKGLIAKRHGLFCSIQKMFLLNYLLAFYCRIILKFR